MWKFLRLRKGGGQRLGSDAPPAAKDGRIFSAYELRNGCILVIQRDLIALPLEREDELCLEVVVQSGEQHYCASVTNDELFIRDSGHGEFSLCRSQPVGNELVIQGIDAKTAQLISKEWEIKNLQRWNTSTDAREMHEKFAGDRA